MNQMHLYLLTLDNIRINKSVEDSVYLKKLNEVHVLGDLEAIEL